MCAGAGTLSNAKAILSYCFLPAYAINMAQKLTQVPMSAFLSDISSHCY